MKSSDRLGVKTNAEPSKVVIKPDDSLVLIPVPDDTYTISARYYKSPTRLSANTDTSPIPTAFDNVIIYKAMMYHGAYYGDSELYQTAMADFEREMIKLEGSQLEENEAKMFGSGDPTWVEVV